MSMDDETPMSIAIAQEKAATAPATTTHQQHQPTSSSSPRPASSSLHSPSPSLSLHSPTRVSHGPVYTAARKSPAPAAVAGGAATGLGMSQIVPPSSFGGAAATSALASHPYLAPPPVSSTVTAPAAAAATSSSPSSLHAPMFSSNSLSLSPGSKGTAGQKRKSAQSFDDDDDEHLAKVTRYDSDEEEESAPPQLILSPSLEGMDDDTPKPKTNGKDARAVMAADDEDSSFMSLLNKLATLQLPNRAMKPEQCPLCPESFPIEQFADHVYTCIKKLDNEEKKERERLDMKMATEIAFADAEGRHSGSFGARRGGHHSSHYQHDRMGSGRSTPEVLERQALSKFNEKKQEKCEYGSSCNRTDAQHFISKLHPLVSCPICEEKYQVYEINAHITFCLDTPRTNKADKPSVDRDASMDGSGSAAAAASSSSTFSSAPIALPTSAGLPSSSASLFSRRSRSKMGARSASSTNLSDPSPSPPLGIGLDDDDAGAADDEADDEEEKQASPLGMMDSESRSSSMLHRSTSDVSLSLAQASLMASAVLKRKAQTKPNDASLLDLLNTFSTLGFTRQKLEDMHAAHVNGNSNGNGNGSSSDGKK